MTLQDNAGKFHLLPARDRLHLRSRILRLIRSMTRSCQYVPGVDQHDDQRHRRQPPTFPATFHDCSFLLSESRRAGRGSRQDSTARNGSPILSKLTVSASKIEECAECRGYLLGGLREANSAVRL